MMSADMGLVNKHRLPIPIRSHSAPTTGVCSFLRKSKADERGVLRFLAIPKFAELLGYGFLIHLAIQRSCADDDDIWQFLCMDLQCFLQHLISCSRVVYHQHIAGCFSDQFV